MADVSAESVAANPVRRVFLTGAAGRLGTHTLPVLRAAGYEVLGVDVRANPDWPEARQLNLLDGPAVRAAMEESGGCQAVVHLGNHPSQGARPPAQLFTENVTMTMNVFGAARDLGIRRIVYASTIQVVASEWLPGYSLRRPRLAYLPLDGDLPADPTNTYALSKRVGEMTLAQWATEMDLEAVSLRLPLLLNLDDPKVVARRNRAAAAGEPGATTIAQGFTWLSYRDAAELIGILLAKPQKGARIMLPASPAPRAGDAVAQLLEKYYADVPHRPGAPEPLTSLVDNSAITAATGWTPRDLLG